MKKSYVLFLFISSSYAFGVGETFTESKAGDFAMGQRFVSCAAFFEFAAGMSAEAGKPSAAESMRNLGRGWNMAGMLLLSSGAAAQRFDSKATAASMLNVRLTSLKAMFELGGVNVMHEMYADHQKACDPLVPMQENIIQALRSSSGSAPNRK